jgi:hypothetical protein
MEMTLELKKAMSFGNRFLETLHNEKMNLNLNLSGNLLTVRSGHLPLRTKKYFFSVKINFRASYREAKENQRQRIFESQREGLVITIRHNEIGTLISGEQILSEIALQVQGCRIPMTNKNSHLNPNSGHVSRRSLSFGQNNCSIPSLGNILNPIDRSPLKDKDCNSFGGGQQETPTKIISGSKKSEDSPYFKYRTGYLNKSQSSYDKNSHHDRNSPGFLGEKNPSPGGGHQNNLCSGNLGYNFMSFNENEKILGLDKTGCFGMNSEQSNRNNVNEISSLSSNSHNSGRASRNGLEKSAKRDLFPMQGGGHVLSFQQQEIGGGNFVGCGAEIRIKEPKKVNSNNIELLDSDRKAKARHAEMVLDRKKVIGDKRNVGQSMDNFKMNLEQRTGHGNPRPKIGSGGYPRDEIDIDAQEAYASKTQREGYGQDFEGDGKKRSHCSNKSLGSAAYKDLLVKSKPRVGLLKKEELLNRFIQQNQASTHTEREGSKISEGSNQISEKSSSKKKRRNEQPPKTHKSKTGVSIDIGHQKPKLEPKTINIDLRKALDHPQVFKKSSKPSTQRGSSKKISKEDSGQSSLLGGENLTSLGENYYQELLKNKGSFAKAKRGLKLDRPQSPAQEANGQFLDSGKNPLAPKD